MRVLVCGGRDFRDRAAVWRELNHLDIMSGPLTVMHGAAAGADAHARSWCVEIANGADERHFPADWRTHGRAAGPIRNQRMIDEGKPDLVLAFPGGRGTADMVRRARAADIPVREIASLPHA